MLTRLSRALVGILASLALLSVGVALVRPWRLAAQNVGSLAPVERRQWTDANGVSLPGGFISTYVTGTSTSAVTYTDAALNTRAANPIVLDSAGRATIFLSATAVYRFVVADSANVQLYTQDDIRPVGYTAGQVAQDLSCRVRLTLSSAVPITTADVTGATSIYATPYQGNTCWLYDGTNWSRYAFSETSLALGTDAANTNYDLFAYASGGALTLERLAWTNNLDRATELAWQNGIRVRSGALTRRYLGTYRTTATIGQTEDSDLRRLVWNVAHPVRRRAQLFEDTNFWTYTTATYRAVNGLTANHLAFVVGQTELVAGAAFAHASNSGGGLNVYTAIADGEPTVLVAARFGMNVATPGANAIGAAQAHVYEYARVGFHTWIWVERSAASGTTTWYGDNGASNEMASGMVLWLDN